MTREQLRDVRRALMRTEEAAANLMLAGAIVGGGKAIDESRARLLDVAEVLRDQLEQHGTPPARRFCEPCERWTNARECEKCGADTVKPRTCGARHEDGTGRYRCTLLDEHTGDHIDTRNPMHPSWKR